MLDFLVDAVLKDGVDSEEARVMLKGEFNFRDKVLGAAPMALIGSKHLVMGQTLGTMGRYLRIGDLLNAG